MYEKKIKDLFKVYLITLLIFSYFFLHYKHQVGNDSTISEWLINYEGGFTKRGLVGQIAISLSRFFDSDLRWVIFIMQSFICSLYFTLIYIFFKNLKFERITVLSIFTPIFILYPVAEIEVLARKEIIIFSLFLLYLLTPKLEIIKYYTLIIFTILSTLIWEPVIFFFPLILILEIFKNKIDSFNIYFFKILICFIPSLIISGFFILNPLSIEEHELMSKTLIHEFNEVCYMSCALLKYRSSIYQQFSAQFDSYSLEVILRYILILIFGFYPILILLKNSIINNKRLIFSNFIKTPLKLFIFIWTPTIVLFAMAYDWGRWVNVSYSFVVFTYFYLLKQNHITLDYYKLKNNIISKAKKSTFLIFVILFCFGWNQKTVITDDVASIPGYRIPYKVFKIMNN